MRRFLWLGVACAALALSSSAFGATKQFWFGPYDRIGEDISGIPDLRIAMEDDYGEWADVEGAFGVPSGLELLGAAFIFAPSTSPLYHVVIVSPDVTRALTGTLPLTADGSGTSPIWDRVASGTLSYQDAAVAILTVIHEAYHYRLASTDEARVNACALRDLPTYLSTEFQIPQTTTVTVQVPQTTVIQKRVPYYATVVSRKRVGGRLVTVRTRVQRYRTESVTQTTMVSKTETQENPAFDGIVAAAQAFRDAQPPPYNSGTCF